MTAGGSLATLTILFCAALAHPAIATVVLPMTVEELADSAAQVIDGVVEDVSSFTSDDGRTIRTRVRFMQTTYLKGRLPGSTDAFEFVVPGGEVGDRRLRLTGAPQFVVGDRWLLFLHPTYNIHPVVGIYCGALRMIADSDGVVRAHDYRGRAIVGIDDRGFFRTVGTEVSAAPGIEIGSVSSGVTQLHVKAQVEITALSVGEFVGLLEPILANSRSHALSEPAGRLRRLIVTGVPLSVRGVRAVPMGDAP